MCTVELGENHTHKPGDDVYIENAWEYPKEHRGPTKRKNKQCMHYGRRERKWGRELIWKILAKTVLNLRKDKNIQIQEAQ